RIPVSTYIAPYTQSLVYDAITREYGRGGQSFIVYNKVEKIDAFAHSISTLFPDLKISVAHGQMDKKILEDRILRFENGQIDVLVTSTIIENGIDMANVNTMIVTNADKLGLSQLYQLRGRIGRSNSLAYAFFTYDENKSMTESAEKRLEAIATFTDFNSGFKLAMRDLEIRGAGNVLGREQHGHLQRIGYDMYLQLISEVMDEINGRPTKKAIETKVNTDFAAFIPDTYILDIEWRLKAYTKIASIQNQDEAVKCIGQIKDTYGQVPVQVKNLALISLIKNLANGKNAIEVSITKRLVYIKFASLEKIDNVLIKNACALGFVFNQPEAKLVLRPDANSINKVIKLLQN
ncbi:MAG: transcription-repair coupling factor, partial [Firmicutes bacterium]|nr:transcription-repair coupling factor [Bacillota bacterium]